MPQSLALGKAHWCKLMFGGLQAFVPDSADDPEVDDFQVVYAGDERREGQLEDAPAGRAARLRYSAAYAGGTLASQRAGGSTAAAGLLQHPAGSPVASGGHGAVADPGSPVLSAPQQQEAQLTLAQQIQTVLHGMTQQPQAGVAQPPPAAQQQQQAQAQVQQQAASLQQPPQRQRRHSGQIKHSSPAGPPQATLPAGGGPPSGVGQRRWRQAQAAAAAQRQQQSPAVPPYGGGSSFFAVDDDLLQAAQRQAAQQQRHQQAGRRRQPRTVQWDSPQAPAAAPIASQQPGSAEQTPVQSQRPNPLASLLHGGGGGGGSASRPRPATTGSKPRGRHPIYGQAPATAAAAPAASQPSAREGSNVGGGTASSSRQLREALGLRDPPLTSPRQLQQARRPPQHRHSRFAIREPAQVAAEEAAASQAGGAAGAAGAVPAAAGLRLLTGGEPASAQKEQFQPRPRRAPTPSDRIVDDEEDSMNGRQLGRTGAPQQQQQQQQQRQLEEAGAMLEGAAAADAFRTPGQHLRSGRPEGSAADAAAAAVAAAAGAAPDSSGRPGAPGSSGGKGALSLQRQFIAQLQPVSRPAAAATMQQQRQRLAGAAGLHARMQAILVAEKAGLDAQSPGGGAAAAAAPRLMVLQKELEGSITKCLCRCDGAAQAALGVPEVVALLQKSTAREVDTAPGCTLLLRQPWRIINLPGSQWPVVLCYSAAMG